MSGEFQRCSVFKKKNVYINCQENISNYSNLVTTGLLLAANYKSTTFRSEQNPMFRAAESHSL
jgi:hypothetical protein